MLLHTRKLSTLLMLLAFLFVSAQAMAQAPNPLPAPYYDVAILVVDDFGDPFGAPLADETQTTAIDCLLLHTIDPGGGSQQGQASRALGMGSRSLGMIGDESNITIPHGQFVFTQFVDFANPNAYANLDLENWVLSAFLDGSNNFTRFTYPTSHTLSGMIPTNPNGIEFSGYDLIPVHATGDNADDLDENLTDAISRTIAAGYTDVVVNMSFGFFDCDDRSNYITDPETTVDNVASSDFHTAITNLKSTYPNVIFVASSGNFSKNSPFAPAVWDEVISVDGYETIDTVANLSERELFMARVDIPANNFSNVGSVLMPKSWGDNTQNNATFLGETVHKVHFEGTSFAAPWFSMFLAQFLDQGGSTCNSGTVENALTLDWNVSQTDTSRNIETIVRKLTCPELHTTGYMSGTQQLFFDTYTGSPNLALSVTLPLSGTTVGNPVRFEGFAYDQNAGTANGAGINWVRIYEGSNCSGTLRANLNTGSEFVQAGLDVTYDNSGYGTDISFANGSQTLTACAQSLLDTGAPIVKQSVTVTVDSSVSFCNSISFPTNVSTAPELVNAMTCANLTAITDTINLVANITLINVNNTLTGNNGLPVITTPMIINGANHILERDEMRTDFRIFDVEATGKLTLNDMTIRNGYSPVRYGGAIYSDGVLNLTNVSLSNNKALSGGAINSLGELTMVNSSVINNSSSNDGGGIFQGFATLTIVNSTFSGNASGIGGAIRTYGASTISDSTFSNNTASSEGGGLWSWDDTTIHDSTISNNYAPSGGGIFVSNNSATLVNSTISGNSASQGGGIQNNATVTIVNSTLQGNSANTGGALLNFDVFTIGTLVNSFVVGNSGGGISNSGTLTIDNSTLAGNTLISYGGAAISNWYDGNELLFGGVANITNSIIWGNYGHFSGSQLYTGQYTSMTVTANGIEGGVAGIFVEGGATLSDGGDNLTLFDTDDVFVAAVRANESNTPNTFGDYHLSNNSVVIDQGDDNLLPADTQDIDGDMNTAEDLPQDFDGDARVQANALDMGADERFNICPASPFSVSVNTDIELIFYMDCANATALTDTITLSASIELNFVHNFVDGNNGLPSIGGTMKIVGNTHRIERSTTISETFRILHIDQTGRLEVDNIMLNNGSAQDTDGGSFFDDDGGSIFNAGTLVMNSMIVQNSDALDAGGALVSFGTTVIRNSEFVNNTAVRGGGIYNQSGPLTLLDGTNIEFNTASGDGGGLYINGGGAAIHDSNISNNSATGWGGGGIRNNSTLRIYNSTLMGNDAVVGGALYTINGLASTLNNTIVSGNHASAGSGAIFSENTTLNVRLSTITGNYAPSSGGISNFNVGTTNITNSVVWGNYATSNGTQLYNDDLMNVTASAIEGGLGGAGGGTSPTNGGGNLMLTSSSDVFVNALRANGSNTPNTSGDYHLSGSSVVINQGDNSLIPIDVFNDFEGDNRIILTTVDMGADEIAYPLPPADTNLMYNPGFTLGVNKDAGWRFYGPIQHTVDGSQMRLWFEGAATGWMRQFRTVYPLQIGLDMEATIDVKNTEAVTKTVRLIVRDSDLTENWQCVFTIPPNAPMRTYTMRFLTGTNWEIIRFDVRPDDASDPEGLLFDNMNLQYRPGLTITSKVCIPPTLPPLPAVDTNLIFNPNFTFGVDGENGWSDEGSIISNQINPGTGINVSFPGAVDGWLRQYRHNNALRAGLKMVAWVNVSNPDPVIKTFQVMMRDNDLSNTYLCSFEVPANAPARNYYMRFITTTDWEIIRVDLRVNEPNGNDLNLDDVNLRYRPTANLVGLNDCVPPNFSDEVPPLPPETELVLTE